MFSPAEGSVGAKDSSTPNGRNGHVRSSVRPPQTSNSVSNGEAKVPGGFGGEEDALGGSVHQAGDPVGGGPDGGPDVTVDSTTNVVGTVKASGYGS